MKRGTAAEEDAGTPPSPALHPLRLREYVEHKAQPWVAAAQSQLSRVRSNVRRRVVATGQLDVIGELKFQHWRWLCQALIIAYAYYLLLRFWAEDWQEWSSMNDPFSRVWVSAPLGFTVIYAIFIRSFTRYMENRKPVERRVFEALIVYNLTQIVVNAWCFFAFLQETRLLNMSIWGNRHDKTPTGYRLGFLIWVHYNNKYVDMLDTVFIIIRKKYGQMTYLHYVQRLLLVWSWYLVCRNGAGGDSYFGATVHSGVSVFTYSYYLCSQLNIRFPWKSGITFLHMFQCVVCAAHSCFVLWYGNVPRFLAVVQLMTMLKMLILFTNFQSDSGEECDPDPFSQAQSPVGRRVTLSFDSSGWLYLYHFGVAHFIQEAMLKGHTHLPNLAFSGSSGGSLAACSLATHVDIPGLKRFVIGCRSMKHVNQQLRFEMGG